MTEDFLKPSKCYGIIEETDYKFNDNELFKEKSMNKYNFIKKIKIWYGSPCPDKSVKQSILGIQCEYNNNVLGTKKTSELHSGDLKGSDILINELELSEGEFVCKMFIKFGDNLRFLKFVTNKGKELKAGKEECGLEINIPLNEKEGENMEMINSFYGYYDKNGLKSLGCYHISKKNYVFLNCLGIFRLRHIIKTDQNEELKWKDKNNVEKLNDDAFKATAMLCLLPDTAYFEVIKFMA